MNDATKELDCKTGELKTFTLDNRGEKFSVINEELTTFAKERQKLLGLESFIFVLEQVCADFRFIMAVTKKKFPEISERAFELGAKKFYELFKAFDWEALFPENLN